MSDLSTAVFQALGAASTCWTDTAFGTFDSDRAVRIGDDLMAKIEAHVSDERDKVIAEVQELLSRQRILHNELIAPHTPKVMPVLIQVDQVEELLARMKGKP